MQVLPALESGGVERGTLEVAKYLTLKGHRSIVISAGGRMTAKLRKQGSEHLPWDIGRKSLWTLRYIPRVRKFLHDNKVDILHVRSRFPAWICYLAWRGMDPATRPRLVTTVHGPYSVNAYSAIMTKGERVIVISEMIKQYVLSRYSVNADKLRLIYRGVSSKKNPYGYRPTKKWLEAWYQDFPQTRDKNIITLPARITRWKGQSDFLDVIAKLKQHDPMVHGLIVGETKKGKEVFLSELKIKAQALGINDHITFTGHRNDVRDIMSISKVVMSLSLQPEAFGRTTLEALSLAVPVIAYAHGGVDEQLAEFLPEGGVPVGDISAVASLAIDWLNKAPIVLKSDKFSLKSMLENTLSVYMDVLEDNTQP